MDKYEQELEDELINLKDCQDKNKVKSCQQCDLYLDCWLRKKYVASAYNSMNKGKGGGFEF